MRISMIERVCLLIFILVGFASTGWAQESEAADGNRTLQSTRQARTLQRQRFEQTVAKPGANVKHTTTSDGYLKFLCISPGERVVNTESQGRQSKSIADQVIEQGKGLWHAEDEKYAFEHRNTRMFLGHHFVQYRQTYGGLGVYNGWLVVDVDAQGQVAIANCRAMRAPRGLRNRQLRQTNIDSEQAQEKAIAWMKIEHPDHTFETSEPELMIFDPEILQKQGTPQVVWSIEVQSVDQSVIPMGILLEADTGRIVHNYALGAGAFTRRIYNQNEDLPPVVDTTDDISNDSTDPVEMDSIAVARYLEDAYEFYTTIVCNPNDDMNGNGFDTIDDFDVPV